MIRTLLAAAAVAALAGSPGAARAATIHVPADHSTIQAALLAASAGDTVLVAPGRYAEMLTMTPGAVLKSSAGPDSTVLVSAGLGGGPLSELLLECPEECGPDTVIEGFTFDDGGFIGKAILCTSSSPTIRGNVILGFGWSIHLEKGADALIEENRIEKSRTFGVLVFASAPVIRRNTFVDNNPSAITISGKDAHPVIGGSPENTNVFVGSYTAIRNDSRNDIDATWNDWGWEVMAEMEQKGYPADIATIDDGNNSDKSHRGRGDVDYRNWIRPEEKSGGERSFPVWLALAIAVVLAGGFVVIARR